MLLNIKAYNRRILPAWYAHLAYEPLVLRCGLAPDPPRVDCIAQLVESIAADKLLPRSQNVIISSPYPHFAVESRAPFSIGTFPACSFACISRLYDVTTFICPFRFGCLNGPDARRTLLRNRRFLRPRTFK